MRGMRAAFVLTMVFATGLAVGTADAKVARRALDEVGGVSVGGHAAAAHRQGRRPQHLPRAVGHTRRARYHITTLNPNQSPHPPHQHVNEEVIIVKEGAVEAFVNGAWTPVTTGSLIFFASNVPHTVRNVGTVAATYHVVNWKTAGAAQKATGAQ